MPVSVVRKLAKLRLTEWNDFFDDLASYTPDARGETHP